MSSEDRHEIVSEIREIIEASHLAQAKTTSHMWEEVKQIRANQNQIIKNENEFQMWVREQLSEIKLRAVQWDLGTKGVLGMFTMVIVAFFGAVINFFIKGHS